MSRYIDVSDLNIPSDENDYDELVAFADKVAEMITDAPSIDIVRCKECRYWTNDGMQFDNNLVIAPCKQWLQYTRMNGYCHNGERKESER